MSAADIPNVPASILKRKSNINRTIDSASRHTIETNVDANGTAKTSVVKRKIPSTKAHVPTMPEKQFAYTGKVYEREHPEELNEINADANHYENEANYVSKYTFNHRPERAELDEKTHSNLKNRKKIKKANKEFDWKKGKNSTGKRAAFDGAAIQNDTFSEVGDSVIITPPPFRKAPARDARELGLAKKSKSVEPAGIAAISEQKRKIKSELFKPSKEARNNRNNNKNGDDWLIDEAFDNVVKAGKAVGKVAKATGKVAGKAIKEGFQATKKGIQGFNELSDEIVKNPMLVRMGQAHEATLNGMASQRRHARGSIAAVGNNKRYVTAGSLVIQKGFVAHNNATIAPQTANRLRVVTKIVRRGNRDEVLYFLENGRQVTRNQARLIQEGIMPPALKNNASPTPAQAYSGNNTGSIMGKSAKSASGLVTRKHNTLGTTQTTTTNTVLNKTKTASPSGLVTRNRRGLGTNQSIGNPVDDSQRNPIGAITKKTTASGLITGAKNGLGATQMSNNPVLNIAKIASPSRLARRTHSGVV